MKCHLPQTICMLAGKDGMEFAAYRHWTGVRTYLYTIDDRNVYRSSTTEIYGVRVLMVTYVTLQVWILGANTTLQKFL